MRASTLRWLRLLKRLIKERLLNEIFIPKRLETTAALRQRLHSDSIARRNALIPPDAAKLESAIALLKKAKAAEASLRAGETSLAETVAKTRAVNQARDAFYQAREKAIQKVFDQIASKVLQYYKKLHDIDGDAEKSECTGLSLESTSRAAAGGLKLAIQFFGTS